MCEAARATATYGAGAATETTLDTRLLLTAAIRRWVLAGVCPGCSRSSTSAQGSIVDLEYMGTVRMQTGVIKEQKAKVVQMRRCRRLFEAGP